MTMLGKYEMSVGSSLSRTAVQNAPKWIAEGLKGMRIGAWVLCTCAVLALGSTSALAETGDVYQVTGEKVNLRSGPSDNASIRSTVSQGVELIELKREGSWIGVRVEETGQEGWVFSELVRRVASTDLDSAAGDAFARISPEFDRLLADIGGRTGYGFIRRVQQTDGNRLRVSPTQAWMDRADLDAKLMTVLAIYEMWKNHNNGRAVDVDMVDRRGNRLLGIADGASGPQLTVDESMAAR